jgi:hypothetical protein
MKKIKKNITEETDIKEAPPLSHIKEASIIAKETTKENILIIQGMN